MLDIKMVIIYIFSRKIVVFEKNIYYFAIFSNNDIDRRTIFYPTAAIKLKGFLVGMSFYLIQSIMD